MKIKKILREPLFYLLPLLVAAYVIVIPTRMEFSNIKSTRNDNTENIKLPYSFDGENSETFIVSFNLLVKNKTFAEFDIIPDDCIQEISINGKMFPLDGVRGLCDWTKGAYFDFSKYVEEGLNYFELHILNRGGPGGLRVDQPYNGFKSLSLMHYIFALLFLFSTALILRKFKFNFIAIFIILLGISVRLILYTYVGPSHYAYDTGGHLEYIKIISEEKRLPKVNEGWSTYHPPAYYIASATLKTVADKYDQNYANRVLQQGNLLLSIASIIFGVALMLNLFGRSFVAYLAAIISVLWPGYVLAAPRISNDVLFYFGTLFCMMFAQRYWRVHKSSDMILATIGAVIAFSAKSNGYVILCIWIIIHALNVLRFWKIGSLRALFAATLIVLLGIWLSNHRIIADIYDGKKAELIGNISGLNGALGVKNNIGNYLYFDMQDYLLEPYVSPWVDKGGRQYFWNYALKTSLFGEFRFWDAPTGRVFATMLSVLLLFMMVFALWGIIHTKVRDFPAMLFAIFLFAALIYIRVKYPYSAVNDFRFILPAVFPITYFSVRGVEILQNFRLRMLSYAILLSFASLSFLFIIGRAFV
jgi:hypothetical protein